MRPDRAPVKILCSTPFDNFFGGRLFQFSRTTPQTDGMLVEPWIVDASMYTVRECGVPESTAVTKSWSVHFVQSFIFGGHPTRDGRVCARAQMVVSVRGLLVIMRGWVGEA